MTDEDRKIYKYNRETVRQLTERKDLTQAQKEYLEYAQNTVRKMEERYPVLKVIAM